MAEMEWFRKQANSNWNGNQTSNSVIQLNSNCWRQQFEWNFILNLVCFRFQLVCCLLALRDSFAAHSGFNQLELINQQTEFLQFSCINSFNLLLIEPGMKKAAMNLSKFTELAWMISGLNQWNSVLAREFHGLIQTTTEISQFKPILLISFTIRHLLLWFLNLRFSFINEFWINRSSRINQN